MQVENIVLEGGGVKGIAYGGAISALEKQIDFSKVKNVAGTSAGSIAAFLIAIGLSGKQIGQILCDTQFRQFQDDNIGLIRNGWRLMTKYGICTGEKFITWAKKVLADQHLYPDITFKDFERIRETKNLFVVATNVSKGRSEVFCAKNTPNVKVVDALRMSMSIPFYYATVRYNGDYYVDGGVLNNFPIRIFDSLEFNQNCHSIGERLINPNTLGFRLDTTGEVQNTEKIKTNNIFNFAVSIFNLIYGYEQTNGLDSHDWDRTIRICIDNISAIDFDLTDDQKQQMLKSGYDVTMSEFSKKGV
jgi:NTE family protein